MSDFLPDFSLVIIPSRHKLLSVNRKILTTQTVKIEEGDILLFEGKESLEKARGEVVVFLRDNYKPASEWLQEILSPFSKKATNIVVGQIKQKNYYPWNFWRKKTVLAEIWRHMGNCAVRRDFLAKILTIQLPEKFPEEEMVYYYRIFRELESEIVYQEKAIVYEI